MRVTSALAPEPASLVVVGAAAAVVVVAAVAAGALVLVANRRRGTSEVHSVDHYRRTLHTLSDIHSRPSSSVRVIGRDEPAPPAPGPSRERSPLPGTRRAPGARSGPGAPVTRGLVFGDDAEAGAGQGADRSRGRARAMSAMNHGPRRLGAPVAVIVAVAAVLGIVVYLGSRSHPPTKTPSGTASHATTTTVAGGGGHGGKGGKGSGTHPTVPTTTTTTLPTSYSPVEASATAGTYMAPDAHYTLGVSATTAACWVGVTTATGTTTYAQTLAAGGSHTVTATGTLTVVIGAPTVVVTINRVPLVLPSGFATPFTMTIDVATSGSGSSGATTTTTTAQGATTTTTTSASTSASTTTTVPTTTATSGG